MGKRWVVIAPMLAFGIIGSVLLVYLLETAGGEVVQDSLLPELIGFCFEGFFIVGVFSYFQHAREHERRTELWMSLRGSLRDMLSHLDAALLPTEGEPASSKALESDPKVVDRLIADIDQVELDVKSMAAMKKLAAEELELLHDLIPVAAQLSAQHMRWWIAIVEANKRLADATDRHRGEVALRKLLVNLREFDAEDL